MLLLSGCLFSVISYRVRVEALLLKEEWSSTAGALETAVNALLVAGDDLMSSRAIQVPRIYKTLQYGLVVEVAGRYWYIKLKSINI